MPEYTITSSVDYDEITYSYCDIKQGLIYESTYEFEHITKVVCSYSHKKTS